MWPITAMTGGLGVRAIVPLFHHKNGLIATAHRFNWRNFVYNRRMFWKRRTYLDYAAGVSGNPSSPHEEGRHAKKLLEDARTSIARLLEVQSDDVIFTSGATESNALAILGHAMARKTAGKKGIHM